MRELLTVSRVDEQFVYLRPVTDGAGCSSCTLAGACSAKGGTRELKVPKQGLAAEALPGDRLLVEIKYNEAVISMILYGIPLLGFITGVFIGYIFRWTDVQSFLTGIFGATAGLWTARLFDRKLEIRVIEKVPTINLGEGFEVELEATSEATEDNGGTESRKGKKD